MLLKNGGWASGQFLTIIEARDGAQIVRVAEENTRTGGTMRTKEYQYRTRTGVEVFRRLKDVRAAHPSQQ